MRARRAIVLLALAGVAALTEALATAATPELAYQTLLVMQLLGVIIAAIAIAALTSRLGLALAALLAGPALDRPSVFTAWAFLRSHRVVPTLWRRLLNLASAIPGRIARPQDRAGTFALTALLAVLSGALLVARIIPSLLGADRATQIAARDLGLGCAVAASLEFIAALRAPASRQHLAPPPPVRSKVAVTLPTFISIVGVAAGVWALIVVLSVMGGFATDLRKKILLANAHAIVERKADDLPVPHVAKLAAMLRRLPGIEGASPQVRGDVILASVFNVHNFVGVRGVDPTLPEVERDLGRYVRVGALRFLREAEWLAPDQAFVPLDVGARKDVPDAPPIAPAHDDTEGDSDEEATPAPAGTRLAPGPRESPTPSAAPLIGGEAPIGIGGDEPVDIEGSLAKPPPGAVLPIFDPRSLDDRLDAPLPASLTSAPIHPGMLLGVELARSLQVDVGDEVQATTPDADVGPLGMRPRTRTFRVAGTFQTGLYEADSKVVFMDIGEAARFFNVPGGATKIELRMSDPEHPEAVLGAIERALREAGAPPDTRVVDWRALNRGLFTALQFERLVVFLVLGLIILVAAFSIVAALTMVILQKSQGIAMLRAMGASAGDIRAAFLNMGLVIGLIGTATGLALGLATCGLIRELGIALPEAYYVRTLPVDINPFEVSAVVLAAVAVTMLATLFPATSAARLLPLEGLRNE